MRTIAAALAVLCTLTATPAVAATPTAPSGPYAELDAYVRDRMRETGVPGLSYAVVGPDGPVHRRAWGTDGRGDPVTPATPFLWGSLAKPATATGVMTLVESGRLGLDDRVAGHVPEFGFAPGATVRHLLGQTSGLPAEATFEVADCHAADCPRPAGRLGALDGVEPLGPPGTEYAYTSANYLALAAVVESVTGRPFADFMHEAVFDPIGMDGAIADAESARRLPPGHQLLWGFPTATKKYDPHGAAYGYLGGDLHDLTAFASAQLRGTVLKPESLRLMRQETKAGTGYGLGWRVGGLDGPLRNAIWHTGGAPGYSAMIFLLPERGIGLVLQQNMYALLQDGAVMKIGFGAARVLAGGEPGDAPSATVHHATVWGVTALALALLLAAARSVAVVRRPARPPVTLAWCAAGLVPWGLAAAVQSVLGVRHLWSWVPDAALALGAAVLAGTATVAVRLVALGKRSGPSDRTV